MKTEGAFNMNDDWPCTVNFDMFFGPAKPASKMAETPSIGSPGQGQGDRCLLCDRYERCLDFADSSGWDGFNCESCDYEKQGPVVFCYGEFLETPDDPWDDWDYDFEGDPELPLSWEPDRVE
jgi:hypothetical protein